MGNTNKPKDLLGDILQDSGELEFHGVEALNALIMDLGREGKNLVTPKKISKKGTGRTRKKSIPKKKTTHYLLHEIFVDLDSARTSIRQLVPEGNCSKVTKSAIVNHSLQVALDEFEAKGVKSLLVKSFMPKKEKSKKKKN